MNRSLRARLSIVGVTCVAAASLGAGIGSAASRSVQAPGSSADKSDVAYARLFATVAPANAPNGG